MFRSYLSGLKLSENKTEQKLLFNIRSAKSKNNHTLDTVIDGSFGSEEKWSVSCCMAHFLTNESTYKKASPYHLPYHQEVYHKKFLHSTLTVVQPDL